MYGFGINAVKTNPNFSERYKSNDLSIQNIKMKQPIFSLKKKEKKKGFKANFWLCVRAPANSTARRAPLARDGTVRSLVAKIVIWRHGRATGNDA